MEKVIERFQSKLIAIFISVFIFLGLMLYLVNMAIQESAVKHQIEHINATQDIVTQDLKNYFDKIDRSLKYIISNRELSDIVKEFISAFHIAKDEYRGAFDREQIRSQVDDFVKSSDCNYTTDELLEKVYSDNRTFALQNLYVFNNPFYHQARGQLFSSKQNLSYDTVHKRHHSYFLKERDDHQLQDMMIFDLDGYLIYSTKKGLDFAVNIDSELFRHSEISKLYQLTKKSKSETTIFSDFAPYITGVDGNYALISTPIIDNSKKMIGVLIVAVSPQRVEEILFNGEKINSVFFSNRINSYIFSSRDIVINNRVLNSSINLNDYQDDISERDGLTTITQIKRVDIHNINWTLVSQVGLKIETDKMNREFLSILWQIISIFAIFLFLLLVFIIKRYLWYDKKDSVSFYPL